MDFRPVRVTTDEAGNGETDLLLAAPSSWIGGWIPAATVIFDPACRPDYEGTIVVTLTCLASGLEHYLTRFYGDPPAHGADDLQLPLNFAIGRGVKVKVTGGPPSTPDAVTVYVFIA
ncbi:MAG: hypothetical protein MUP14_02380 [Dehalococcoidia bacterium]|nr:hypothetical protein [Dehalococcoidia bacterium]